MRIGLSAWRLAGQRLGIGRYIEYLLKYWNGLLEPSDRVIIFVHEPFEPRSLSLSDQFQIEVIKPRLTNAVWENALLPRHLRGIDVLFGPSYTLPLLYRGKSVVAIHSVDLARHGYFPWWHEYTYEMKYRLSAQKADLVIVNAQSVKERVEQYYGIPEQKIEVVWLGADYAFSPIDDVTRLGATRVKYIGDDLPFVLFVGGLSMRRNVPLLMRAFARVKREYSIPHKLLMIGPNRGNVPVTELTTELGLHDSAIQIDGHFEHHSELAAIYAAADMFVMPSASEGFSLTLAEAICCATPALTSSRGALGEVANGYAYTFSDLSEEVLANSMWEVLSQPELRARLRMQEIERSKLLRWHVTAKNTLNLLRRIAES
jgi:glycosyltransferase involved in cell wall biosynthesis